eukprot:352712-Chlamydomonas_euryale.AAC.15
MANALVEERAIRICGGHAAGASSAVGAVCVGCCSWQRSCLRHSVACLRGGCMDHCAAASMPALLAA